MNIEFNPVWNRDNIKFNHHKNIPNNFRMLIVGPSGCGKTFLLLQILLEPNFLDYNNLIIFSPTISQNEFKLLDSGFSNCLNKKDIIEIFNTQHTFDNDLSIETICEKIKDKYSRNEKTVHMEMFKTSDKLMDPIKLKIDTEEHDQ